MKPQPRVLFVSDGSRDVLNKGLGFRVLLVVENLSING